MNSTTVDTATKHTDLYSWFDAITVLRLSQQILPFLPSLPIPNTFQLHNPRWLSQAALVPDYLSITFSPYSFPHPVAKNKTDSEKISHMFCPFLLSASAAQLIMILKYVVLES